MPDGFDHDDIDNHDDTDNHDYIDNDPGEDPDENPDDFTDVDGNEHRVKDDNDHAAGESIGGDATNYLIAQAARLLDEQAEEAGWDNPSVLWRVDMPTVNDVIDIELDDSTFGLAMGFTPLAEFECHPNDVLLGLDIDGPACIGAALVTEAWSFPLDADGSVDRTRVGGYTRPSEHPQRVELRMVLLVLRDGSAVATMRTRGDDEPRVFPLEKMQLDGTVVRCLRRAIGLHSTPGGPSVPLEYIRTRLTALSYVTVAVGLVEAIEKDIGVLGAREQKILDGQLVGCAEQLEAAVRDLVHDTGFTRASWVEVLDQARLAGVPEILGSAGQLAWFDDALWADWLDVNLPSVDDCIEKLRELEPVVPRFVQYLLGRSCF